MVAPTGHSPERLCPADITMTPAALTAANVHAAKAATTPSAC